jgi:hypothetical protein
MDHIPALVQTIAILGAALAVVVDRTLRVKKRKNGESDSPTLQEAVWAVERQREMIESIREMLKRQDEIIKSITDLLNRQDSMLEVLEKLYRDLENRPCAEKERVKAG